MVEKVTAQIPEQTLNEQAASNVKFMMDLYDKIDMSDDKEV